MDDRSREPAPAADLDRASVRHGALVGFAVLTATALTGAVAPQVVDGFEEGRWDRLLVLGLFAGYFLAGYVAGQRTLVAPLRHGTVAALGAFGAWIPVRILIWAARDSDRGLFTGDEPVFTAGAVFGQLLMATTFGMLGALTRRSHRRRAAADGSEPRP